MTDQENQLWNKAFIQLTQLLLFFILYHAKLSDFILYGIVTASFLPARINPFASPRPNVFIRATIILAWTDPTILLKWVAYVCHHLRGPHKLQNLKVATTHPVLILADKFDQFKYNTKW